MPRVRTWGTGWDRAGRFMPRDKSARPHRWVFAATSGGLSSEGTSPIAIAICDRCGVIRGENVWDRLATSEQRLDLSGVCPDAPDPLPNLADRPGQTRGLR